MTLRRLNRELDLLLEGADPAAALRVLHFAARLISHRRHRRLDVAPWVAGVAGEPNETERELGREVVRIAEHAAGTELSSWDAGIEREVAEAFFRQAQRVSNAEWGTMGRKRAKEYLERCRSIRSFSEPEAELVSWAPLPSSELRDVLTKLPAEDLELVRLRLQGLDWEESGEKLGVEPMVVRLRWYRILRKLGDVGSERDV